MKVRYLYKNEFIITFCLFYCSEVRIDLNQSLLEYHTSLDGILLAGYKPKSILQTSLLQRGLLEPLEPKQSKRKHSRQYNEEDCDNLNLFARLPVSES